MGAPERAKVLTPLGSQPLLGYVLDCAADLQANPVVVIIGHQRDAVRDYVQTKAPLTLLAVQDQQLGTGHAVLQTQPLLDGIAADIVILSGDVPLLTSHTVQQLVDVHRSSEAALTILTTVVENPTGYGRILRDDKGAVAGIAEQKDATVEQLAIREINSGIYAVKSEVLFDALRSVQNHNAQGEFYLTDIAAILLKNSMNVMATRTDNAIEVHGINTPEDLALAEHFIATRVVRDPIN